MRRPGVRVAVAILVASALTSCARHGVPASAPAPMPPPPVELSDDDFLAPWETEKDPVRARTLKLEEEWRLHPLFTDVPLEFHDLRPALVAVEAGGDPGRSLLIAEKAGNALGAAADRFREFLRESGVDAPALAEMGDTRLRLVLFRDEESMDAWRARSRPGVPEGPHFDARDAWIVSHLDAAEPRDVVELATHALLMEYRRWFLQKEDDAAAALRQEPPVRVQSDDFRIPCGFAWFDWGLARWLSRGDARGDSDENVGLAPSDAWGLRALREARRAGVEWRVNEFLFLDAARVRARARVESGGRSGRDLEALVAIEGAFLLRTLHEGEDGRWRAGLREFIRRSIRGGAGKIDLLVSFGFPKRSDDPAVAAWIAEVDAALWRSVGPP